MADYRTDTTARDVLAGVFEPDAGRAAAEAIADEVLVALDSAGFLLVQDSLRRDGHDHVAILIDREARDRLRLYLMDDAPRGMGYTAFVLDALAMADRLRLAELAKAEGQIVARAFLRIADGETIGHEGAAAVAARRLLR